MTTTNITFFNNSFALKDYLFAKCPNISPVLESSITSSYQNITNQANLMLSSLSFWQTTTPKFKDSIISRINTIAAFNPFNFCQTVDECQIHVSTLSHQLENVKTAISNKLTSNKNSKSKSYIDFTVSPFKNNGPYSHLEVIKNKQTSEWISQVNESLAENRLSLVKTGCSGNFFIKDKSGNIIALLKPEDFTWGGKDAFKPCEVKATLDVTNTVKKEAAAFSLFGDFFNIVETYAIRLNIGGQPRLASLQKYIKIIGDMSSNMRDTYYNAICLNGFKELIDQSGIKVEIGFQLDPSLIPKNVRKPLVDTSMLYQLDDSFHHQLINYPAQKKLYERFNKDEIQKAGLLRLLVGDPDINGGNFLVTQNSKDTHNIVNVDFNLAFIGVPQNNDVLVYFPWYPSHFASEPFSDEIQRYFANLNVQDLTAKLKKFSLPKISTVQFAIRALLIKKAVATGFNLHQMTYSFFLQNSQSMQMNKMITSFLDANTEKQDLEKIIKYCTTNFDNEFEQYITDIYSDQTTSLDKLIRFVKGILHF